MSIPLRCRYARSCWLWPDGHGCDANGTAPDATTNRFGRTSVACHQAWELHYLIGSGLDARPARRCDYRTDRVTHSDTTEDPSCCVRAWKTLSNSRDKLQTASEPSTPKGSRGRTTFRKAPSSLSVVWKGT